MFQRKNVNLVTSGPQKVKGGKFVIKEQKRMKYRSWDLRSKVPDINGNKSRVTRNSLRTRRKRVGCSTNAKRFRDSIELAKE